MKQKLLLKSLLLLFALIAGINSAWADPVTVTITNTDYTDGYTATTGTSGTISKTVSSTNDLTITYSGVNTKSKADANAYSYGYAMFLNGYGYVYNSTTPSGYYPYKVTVTFTSGTGTSGKVGISYGKSVLNSRDDNVDGSVTKSGTCELTNLDQTKLYWNFSTKSANVQVASIAVIYYPLGEVPTVETPTFSPIAGTYYSTQNIEINCGTDGATIHYTTDGNDPTSSSSTYSSAIEVDVNTTIKAIAIKTGLSNSEIASATYTIKSPVEGYAVDFEEGLAAYSDWTFTNAEQGTATQNYAAHGGTHYGTTGGKQTAAFQTKTKIALPGTFTCYVSKTTSNTTSSTWIIQTSDDGTTWTDVQSQDATSMDAGTWVEFTANLAAYSDVYVRLYYSGSTALRTVDDISLTMRSATAPTISASNVNLAYDDTNGSIAYSIVNSVAGGTVTAESSETWLTVENVTNTEVPLTCTANSETTQRTATVTITYTYNMTQTVTKNITVTQEAGPYTTIPDLFSAATTTATDVKVSFNNWVVSGISTNGKTVFVTDGTNGFVIYSSTNQSGTYAEGKTLSGTGVSCSLKKYNGYAQISNLNTSNLTITSGGNVSAANIEMSALAGVNTGALVSYSNLTCTVNNNKYYLSDGVTTLQVYDPLYAFGTLKAGMKYNITGIYQQYSSTKEILPRSAADIVEVAAVITPAKEYTTLTSASALDFTNVAGLEAYIVKDNDASDGYVTLTKVNKVLDGTGLVLKAASTGSPIDVPVFDGTGADDVTGNLMTGSAFTTTAVAANGGYILKNGAFHPANAGNLPAGKAYLNLAVPSNNASPLILDFGDGTTNITTTNFTNGTNNRGEVYNLAGQRVAQPTMGLYIVNGKKFVVK